MNSLFKEQPGSPRLRAMALSLCVSTAALASVGALVAQAQEGDPTDTAATDTPTDTSATDTPPPAPSGPEDVVAPPPPWAGTTDVEPPDFLDTTDRRIVDDRPPPTPDQIRALLEMEAEADRFTRSGTGYRNAIVSILRRDYMRQRRERETGYARQITEEERLTREAMEDAIVHLERFIRRYPSDPNYTPDAMFRLGELYYERAALAFEGGDTDSGHPDFLPVINLYRDLLARFPEYRHVDGVYYLIGYCLNEMGELEEAIAAWRVLVCANHFVYTGPIAPPPVSEELTAEEAEAARIAEHPSLGLTAAEAPEPVPTEFVDPYVGCVPVREGADFAMETWLRLGEYHFDFDPEPFFLERSISAYNYVLQDPTDQHYNLALYKVAWAYYRGSHYPEALEYFGRLVEWSDEEEARTGRAGSELRGEAIQYMALTFAYDDWDEDGIPDSISPLTRIQDPSLMPQDRPWTPEVYFALGDALFEAARYELAIQVWEMAIGRWPLDRRVPDTTHNISRAYARLEQRAEEQRWIEALGGLGPDSDWYAANLDNPADLEHVSELAEAALIQSAIHHHQLATTCRREAVMAAGDGDLEIANARLQCAMDEYRLAADGYRSYLVAYPNSENTYDIQYNLADALYWSEQYEPAAEAYAAVRDSNLNDEYLSEASRRVVESLTRLMEADTSVTVRDAPPEPAGTPLAMTAIEMPALVQRVAQAREIYLSRVDASHDSEGVRNAYDYNNALLLYWYGYWDLARDRFWQIYVGRCEGPDASDEGSIAWTNLRNMAVALGDTEEVRRLANDFNERNCSFTPGVEPGAAAIDCNDPANEGHPRCLADVDIGNIRYTDALELYRQAEEANTAGRTAEAYPLYERSATMLLEAVNADPEHPDAPRALLIAAQALANTGRFDSAARIFQRVVDEVGPMTTTDPVRQVQLDHILGVAYYSLAEAARRSFDYDRALTNYRVLAESARFERSDDPEMPGMREDAIVESARMLEYQQDYTRAADYYRRAADLIDDPAEARTARFRVAMMAYRRRDWNATIREMNSFIDRYRTDASAVEQISEAGWHIVEARDELRSSARDREAAVRAVVDNFTRLRGATGSAGAEYAAHARFILAEPSLAAFEGFAIDPGRPATLDEYVQTILRQIREGSTRAAAVNAEYQPVTEYGRPTWLIAALVRQGRAFEILASAILNAPYVTPADLARRTRGASEEVREEVRVQVEDRIRQALDPETRVVECFAVGRYALAARAARVSSMDNEYTRFAIDRLQAYGDERIAECIEGIRTGDAARSIPPDPTMPAYTPGEFERARRGETLPMETGRAAPPLAAEE
jgi:tetratricopeptide (TPR) repeat protein